MSEILKMRDISKRFPGVLALDNVSLSIERGEVHALLGENGAGKSTLMKILSGAYKKDAGEIIFDGQPVQINSPRQAQELGVSIIYQELNLVPQLSVAENIFLSSLPMKNPACIDWKRVYSDAQTIIDSLEVDINVRSRISSLGIAQQQMVEIAKALNHQAKVIVMDEPSAPLTDKETAKLFKTIAKLKSEGVAVIYISHRLEETMQIADRATIMRDGKTITTVNVSDITIDDLIRGMVGHDLKEQFPKRDCPISEVGFRVEGISREGILNNISFEARKGEVVGICGLVGAGRTETARAIFGIDPKDAGRVFIDGKEAVIRKPLDAINAGIGFVTEDRKTEGKGRKENFYHGVLLGLLSHMENWAVWSNIESGEGYCDILLEVPENRVGVVIEMKYAQEDRMEAACTEALKQIEQRQYAARLKSDGMKNIVNYGIACYRKHCKVKIGKENS